MATEVVTVAATVALGAKDPLEVTRRTLDLAAALDNHLDNKEVSDLVGVTKEVLDLVVVTKEVLDLVEVTKEVLALVEVIKEDLAQEIPNKADLDLQGSEPVDKALTKVSESPAIRTLVSVDRLPVAVLAAAGTAVRAAIMADMALTTAVTRNTDIR